MSIKEKYKSNTTSAVALAAIIMVVALLVIAPMITANASGGNFSAQANSNRRSKSNPDSQRSANTKQRNTNTSQRNKNGQTQRGGQNGNTESPDEWDRKANTNQAQRNTNSNRWGMNDKKTVAADDTTTPTTAPTTPPTRPTSLPKPTGKNLSPQQQKNVGVLVKDLQDIAETSTVTRGQVEALGKSLTTLATDTTRPSEATVNQLAADLADVISDGGLSENDIELIITDIQAVMTSANIPPEEVQAVIDHATAIFTASGVNAGDLAEIRKDLEKIADEITNTAGNVKGKINDGAKKQTQRRRP